MYQETGRTEGAWCDSHLEAPLPGALSSCKLKQRGAYTGSLQNCMHRAVGCGMAHTHTPIPTAVCRGHLGNTRSRATRHHGSMCAPAFPFYPAKFRNFGNQKHCRHYPLQPCPLAHGPLRGTLITLAQTGTKIQTQVHYYLLAVYSAWQVALVCHISAARWAVQCTGSRTDTESQCMA